MSSKEKPYILFVVEKIYLEISEIKKKNPGFSNIDAVDAFIGSKIYNEISKGQFHDKWLKELKKNEFMDINTNKKIPEETIRLLKVQKDMMIKQLFQFPDLYYAKSHYPLEITQRAFHHLWRACETYELWCKESNQNNLIYLKIID